MKNDDFNTIAMRWLLVLFFCGLVLYTGHVFAPLLAAPDPPKLSDANKTMLLISHRDFLSALAQVSQLDEQCRTNKDARMKEAVTQRDKLQKIVDKLTVTGFTLDLDRLTYVEKKPAAIPPVPAK